MRRGSEYWNEGHEAFDEKTLTKKKTTIIKKYKCSTCGNIISNAKLKSHSKIHKAGFSVIKSVITAQSQKKHSVYNQGEVSHGVTISLASLAQELMPFFEIYLIKLAKTIKIEIKSPNDLNLDQDANKIRDQMKRLYQ